ncbi:hypothetical protein F5141DRAFT_1152745, partial [Pisolithus sp. B1]
LPDTRSRRSSIYAFVVLFCSPSRIGTYLVKSPSMEVTPRWSFQAKHTRPLSRVALKSRTNGEAGEKAENIAAGRAVRAAERRYVSFIREETDVPAFIPTWSSPYGRLPTARGSQI